LEFDASTANAGTSTAGGIVANSSTFAGTLTVQPTGSIGLTQSSLAAVSDNGLLEGDTDTFAAVAIGAGGLAQVSDATVAHDINADGGDIFMSCGFVGGNVTIRNELPHKFSDLNSQASCSLTIRGSVSVSNSPSGPGLESAKVGGSVTVANTGTGGGTNDLSLILFDQISGPLTVTGAGPAPTYVSGNVINRGLTCQNNNPDPTDDVTDLGGGVFPNTVFGKRVGETCADPAF
jgi:hypothetical protein